MSQSNLNDRFINTTVSTGGASSRIIRSRARICANCGIMKSPTWRKSPRGETWCNKCYWRNKRILRKARQSCHPPSGNSRGQSTYMSSDPAPTTSNSPPTDAHHDSRSADDHQSHFPQDHEVLEGCFIPQEHGMNPAPSTIYNSSRDSENSFVSRDSMDTVTLVGAFLNSSDTSPGLDMQSQVVPGGFGIVSRVLQDNNTHLDTTTSRHIQSCDQIEALVHQPSLSPRHHSGLSQFHRSSLDRDSLQPRPILSLTGEASPISHHAFDHRSTDGSPFSAMVQYSSTPFHNNGNAEDFADQIHCERPHDLNNILSLYDTWIPETLPYTPERALRFFYDRTAAVHLDALRRGSSVFVATETFIYEEAGENVMAMAFAVLREDYDDTPSLSSNSEPITARGAAQSHLVFGFIASSPAEYTLTSLDDWINVQILSQRLSCERSKSAIWGLGRAPSGPHLPDSRTFRWLQRYLVSDPTSGLRNLILVKSGSDQHQFSLLHQLQADVIYAKACDRVELFRRANPAMEQACIRACQLWFIGVLDEAAKRISKDSQLRFLQVHQMHMSETMVIYRDGFQKINIAVPPHVCSSNCLSHIQPNFNMIVHEAQDALQSLFSPSEMLLRCILETRFTYPTQEQLFHTRIIGAALFKLYSSYLLLNDEQRVQHRAQTLPPLVNARLTLLHQSQSKLIWNYLPVDVEEVASLKLDRPLRSQSEHPNEPCSNDDATLSPFWIA